jgi:hypothetical protein
MKHRLVALLAAALALIPGAALAASRLAGGRCPLCPFCS